MMIKTKVLTSLLLAAIILPASFAFSNETERRVEEQQRQQLERAPSVRLKDTASLLMMEHGGWINYRYNYYGNIDNDRSVKDSLGSAQLWDVRYWMKFMLKPNQEATVDQAHMFYLRLKDRYIQRKGTAPGAKYDMVGPHLDQAYAIVNLQPVWIEAGRRYFNIGRGIIYSNVNDGVQFNYRVPGFNVGIFASKTLPNESNIDTSIPGYDKTSERYFYGTGIGYTGFKDQSLYGFFLAQNDFSDERPSQPDQNYTYNSQYSGIGAKGKFLKSWDYWAEFILETGSSRVFSTDERKDVLAWASDVEIAYAPNAPSRPRFSVEYAIGSGDKDRISVTDTESGNTSGDDKNFLYFGYAPTGFALAPRLSNLQMFRSGVEFYPFGWTGRFKDLKCGLDLYHFHKHRSQGGISDLEATQASSNIGNEIDLFINWRVLSDLSVSVEYGHFMPGSAYAGSADDNENFFSIQVTHSF